MILDVTCGQKAIYRGLHKRFTDREIIFLDVEYGERKHATQERTTSIEPDIIASLTRLPFRQNIASHIIYDPPYLSLTPSDILYFYYGGQNLTDFRHMTTRANHEFKQILSSEGTLLVKIGEEGDKLYYTKRAFRDFKLLLDIETKTIHQRGKQRTHWLVFVKK